MAEAGGPPLGALAAATITVPELDAAIAAYGEFFGYGVRERGTVPDSLARSWAAPAAAGSAVAVLGPESGSPVYLRFVEAPPVPGYRALRTYGWASVELCVADVDALARRLRESPFRILGEPHDLDFSNAIRAMQVEGPAGEVLLLTQIKDAVPGFDLPQAQTFVDRMFVAILASDDLEAAGAYFASRFGRKPGASIETAVWILNDAFALPRETRHRIATVALPGQGLIELDQYPQGAAPRPGAPGQLPPGVAMVSFRCDSLGAAPDAAATPVRSSVLPYAGASAITVTGRQGERVELIGPA